jgi:hypothetical protein
VNQARTDGGWAIQPHQELQDVEQVPRVISGDRRSPTRLTRLRLGGTCRQCQGEGHRGGSAQRTEADALAPRAELSRGALLVSSCSQARSACLLGKSRMRPCASASRLSRAQRTTVSVGQASARTDPSPSDRRPAPMLHSRTKTRVPPGQRCLDWPIHHRKIWEGTHVALQTGEPTSPCYSPECGASQTADVPFRPPPCV